MPFLNLALSEDGLGALLLCRSPSALSSEVSVPVGCSGGFLRSLGQCVLRLRPSVTPSEKFAHRLVLWPKS